MSRVSTPGARSRSLVRRFLRFLVRRSPGGEHLIGFRDRWVRHRSNRKLLALWEARGRPLPPPHPVKQRMVREYARKYRLRVLVETGTFRGEMVEAMRRHFAHVVSIELGDEMYRRAAARFAGQANVRIIHGDSGRVLPAVLTSLAEPALFWLDGHYSEGDTARGDQETPILAELEHILQHPVRGHVILIDDARDFNGTRDYPTLTALEAVVRGYRSALQFDVADDVVRLVCDPPRTLETAQESRTTRV